MGQPLAAFRGGRGLKPAASLISYRCSAHLSGWARIETNRRRLWRSNFGDGHRRVAPTFRGGRGLKRFKTRPDAHLVTWATNGIRVGSEPR